MQPEGFGRGFLPMRGATFFRIAAFAPFFAPPAGIAVSGVLSILGVPGASEVTALFGFLLAGTWIGGLPYVVVTVVALRRLRNAEGAAHARAARWAPVPFVMLISAIFFVIAITESGTGWLKALGIGAAWGISAAVLGYGYVFAALLLYRLGLRRGWCR